MLQSAGNKYDKIDKNCSKKLNSFFYFYFFNYYQREAMKLLAEKNADLERQDIHGDTPFGNC